MLTGSEVTEAELGPLFDRVTGRVLVVDDGELLRGARDRGVGILVGGDISEVASDFSGWQVELRKNSSGILLNPRNITPGDLVGARLSRSSVSAGVQPSRWFANLGDGELTLLQLPSS